MPIEGIQIDAFDHAVAMICIAPFGMPLGLAHAEPIGGVVTGARKARQVHKGLGQDHAVAIALFPAASPRTLKASTLEAR